MKNQTRYEVKLVNDQDCEEPIETFRVVTRGRSEFDKLLWCGHVNEDGELCSVPYSMHDVEDFDHPWQKLDDVVSFARFDTRGGYGYGHPTDDVSYANTAIVWNSDDRDWFYALDTDGQRNNAKVFLDEWIQWANGDCWGYVVKEITKCSHCGYEHGEVEDSLWGMIGYDYAMEEAESVAKALAEEGKACTVTEDAL